MGEWCIEPARLDDYEALAILQQQTLAEDGCWQGPELAQVAAQGVCLLARQRQDPKTPQGFVLCQVIAPEAEIILLTVASEVRRQGVGRQLIEQLKAALKQQQVERLLLEVSENRPESHAFYQSLGFKKVGKRKNYYKTIDCRIFDAIVMHCDL